MPILVFFGNLILYEHSAFCFRNFEIHVMHNIISIILGSRLGRGNESLQNEASRSILASYFDFVLVTKST